MYIRVIFVHIHYISNRISNALIMSLGELLSQQLYSRQINSGNGISFFEIIDNARASTSPMGHIYGEWSGRNQVHPSSKTRRGGLLGSVGRMQGRVFWLLGLLSRDMPPAGWNGFPSGCQGNLCPTLRASVTTPWLQQTYMCQTDAHEYSKNRVDSSNTDTTGFYTHADGSGIRECGR